MGEIEFPEDIKDEYLHQIFYELKIIFLNGILMDISG